MPLHSEEPSRTHLKNISAEARAISDLVGYVVLLLRSAGMNVLRDTTLHAHRVTAKRLQM